jgi:hypothetical protein
MRALVAAAAHAGEHLSARSIAAKVFCSEGGWEIADTALQLHGGSGYVEETGIALLLRDARVTRIFEGANDVLRVRLGLLEATSPPPRASLAGRGAAGRVADAMHGEVEELRAALRARHGLRLAREQRELHRLGQLAVLRDACDAAVTHVGEPGDAQLALRWLSIARARMAPLLAPPIPRVEAGGLSA